MNVVLAFLLTAWVSVLHDRGDPKQAGVVAPLQVAGVAAGSTVLVLGGAAVIAYGAYSWLGQAFATSDACGNVHVGRGKRAVTPEKAATPTAVPAAEPELTVPTPEQLSTPEATPAPEAPAPSTEAVPAQ
jgi:hypothetical protein